METLNVPRHQTADTPTSQANSNLQVTISNRADGRRLLPLSAHVRRSVRVRSAGSDFNEAATKDAETEEGERNACGRHRAEISSICAQSTGRPNEGGRPGSCTNSDMFLQTKLTIQEKKLGFFYTVNNIKVLKSSKMPGMQPILSGPCM